MSFLLSVTQHSGSGPWGEAKGRKYSLANRKTSSGFLSSKNWRKSEMRVRISGCFLRYEPWSAFSPSCHREVCTHIQTQILRTSRDTWRKTVLLRYIYSLFYLSVQKIWAHLHIFFPNQGDLLKIWLHTNITDWGLWRISFYVCKWLPFSICNGSWRSLIVTGDPTCTLLAKCLITERVHIIK